MVVTYPPSAPGLGRRIGRAGQLTLMPAIKGSLQTEASQCVQDQRANRLYQEKYPTQTEEIKTKAMIRACLCFCLVVALCSAQQWDDYDSKDYNSPSDYDYRSGDQAESSDLDSGLWREEAVFLTPQDREKESLR